jgi:phage-related protein
MPPTNVIFFVENDASCPLLDWLDTILGKARDKCIMRVERLSALGHELRWPEADYLRDDVYEWRVRLRRVNYRMLYFFHESSAVISHGLTKEDVVPGKEIDLAVARRCRFIKSPEKHTYEE